MIDFNRRSLLAGGLGAMATGGLSRAWGADVSGAAIQTILDQTGAPALIGAVVGADGLKHLEATGLRRNTGTEKVSTNDLWHLGSNSKAMTAALYGRLVDRGRARWGATVPELFPDLTLDPSWSKTTVEQLMGHRAGVEERSFMAAGWLMTAHKDARPMRDQRAELAKTIFGKPPGGTPGAFAYANFNYVLVGAAIERIVDAAWEDAIIADLFKPAGIASAGFGAPKGAQPWGHRPAASGAQTLPLALTAVDPAGFADNPPIMSPAGRVHMTMTDYAKFARLFLTRGGGVLKPATVEHLSTPVAGEGGRPYALGWGVATDRPWARGPLLVHEGSNTMWHAVTAMAPARGVAILTVSNGPPPTSASTQLLKQLQERFAAA